MDEIIKSDLFFFISSVGFSLIIILLSILLIYIIRSVHKFYSLVNKLESEIDGLGATAQELLEEMRQSFIYKMVVNPRRKRTLFTREK